MKRIAIVANRQNPTDSVFIDKQDYVNETYIDAVQKAGGIPLLLPFASTIIVGELLEHIDGLLLIGGNDISPSLYGEEENGAKNTDILLDDFHLSLIINARKIGIPILGICRGFQLLNVALGGTLYQDIASEKKDALDHRQFDFPYSPSHDVEIVQGSFLSSIFSDKHIGVNSLHHQGIKTLATPLKPAAYAPDGLIEAFEGDNLYGVQWHPEAMGESMGCIFSEFIKRL